MSFLYRNKTAVLLVVCSLFFVQAAFAQDVDTFKQDIFGKLKCCACQVSFDKCTCPEAKEMKAYIDALLENKISKKDIFYKVAKKFSLNTIMDPQIKQELERRLIKEAGERRPQIIIEPASFDFGQVTKKQGKISKMFKLTNKGNMPLIIKNLKTSCPCASVALKINKNKSQYFGTEGSSKDWRSGVNSKETAELEVIVDLVSPHVKPGKLIRDATIISNDPLYPETIVRVQAEVLE